MLAIGALGLITGIAFCIFYKFFDPRVILIFILFAILMLVLAFSCSYKKYEYNGNIISVYAGFYKHYLCINEEKIDEHNTLFRLMENQKVLSTKTVF